TPGMANEPVASDIVPIWVPVITIEAPLSSVPVPSSTTVPRMVPTGFCADAEPTVSTLSRTSTTNRLRPENRTLPFLHMPETLPVSDVSADNDEPAGGDNRTSICSPANEGDTSRAP